MKIMMMIDGLGIGGAETHVITLAAALASQGNVVCILSAGGLLEQQAHACGIRCLHFPVPPTTTGGWLRCLAFLRRLVRREHFDVLHAHTRRCALLLRFLPRRLHPKALPQDLAPQMLSVYRRRAILYALAPLRVVTAHALFSPRARRLSYWGDVTLAVSEDIRHHLQHCFGCRQRISVIPNGIVWQAPTRKNKAPTLFSVVFASRLDEDCSRAAFALLRLAPTLHRAAAEQGRTLRLVLIGGGSCYPALCRMREELLASSDLSPQSVILTGAVSQPQSCFEGADVFVGVSRAALEAAGCGCAVVLAGNEGYGGRLTAEHFDHHAATNFCCRGERALTDNALLDDLLALLRASPVSLRKACDEVGATVLRRYDASRTATATQRLYVRALAKKRRLRLLCVGYFGRQNLGDESILRCLLRQFSGAIAPVSLSAAVPTEHTPPRTAHLHRRVLPSRPIVCHARRVLYVSDGKEVPLQGIRYKSAGLRAEGKTVHRLSTSVPLRLRVCVLCHRPQSRAKVYRYGGAQAIPRGRWWLLAMALRHSDALLLGGGSLLQNASRHGRRSLLFYLSLPILGRLLGCPFSLRANGIGPVFGRLWQRLTAAVLRRAAGISLRDPRSAALLAGYGVPPQRLSYCADPVAAWAARQSPCATSSAPRGYVCICPREADEGTLRRLLAAAEERWAGRERIYAALDAREDVSVCRRLATMAAGRIVVLQSERAAFALLSHADAVISMRLHALLLAGKAPTVSVPIRATADKLDGEGKLPPEK